MAVLVGVAYLNFEKPGERPEPVLAGLAKLQHEVRAAIVELDQPVTVSKRGPRGKESKVPTSAFKNLKAAFLIFIAEIKGVRYGVLFTVTHLVHRSWCKPPFAAGYFHNGVHIIPISMLTIASVLTFFNAVYISIFPAKWIFAWDSEQMVFWIFAGTITVTFMHLMISRQLSALQARCKKWMAELREQVEAENAATAEAATKRIEKAFEAADKDVAAV